jgi:hypothetical protein
MPAPTLKVVNLTDTFETQRQVINAIGVDVYNLLSGSNSVTANRAETADKLTTPVTIQGVSFDGSQDISMPLNDYRTQKIVYAGGSITLLNSNRTVQNLLIFINGLFVFPEEYTISTNQLTFVTPPTNGAIIGIKYLPLSVGN